MTSKVADPWKVTREPALDVYLLGLLDFDAGLFLQERLLEDAVRDETPTGTLLLCEHPPLLTIGREGSQAHINCEPGNLISRQIEVRWLNRGGGCLLHAPGQLAVYPVLPLARRGIGLADFRNRLEQAAALVCRELHVPAWLRDDFPGVWCRGGQVAQVGVAVRSGVGYHGMFVNVSPRMDFQRWIRTPSGERVTSIAAERMRPTEMPVVRESLMRHLAEQLGFTRTNLYTGHPLLKRTRKVMAHA